MWHDTFSHNVLLFPTELNISLNRGKYFFVHWHMEDSGECHKIGNSELPGISIFHYNANTADSLQSALSL